MTALALKFTRAGRVPSYQGGDPLPRRRWLPEVADPVLCERGWHACRWEDTPHHVAAELWVVKIDGRIIHGADKIACSRMMLVEQITTWDERTQRLWAADCAERVLPIYEEAHPGDDRPRLAIAAARDFAEGRITDAADTAAWDAARDAADTAAWDAARDAERRWQADRLGELCGLDPDRFIHREALR